MHSTMRRGWVVLGLGVFAACGTGQISSTGPHHDFGGVDGTIDDPLAAPNSSPGGGLVAAYGFDEGTGSSVFFYGYYTAMEAIAQALEQVEGVLSDEHAAFRDALANLELEAPLGTIRLDENVRPRCGAAPSRGFRCSS